MAYNMTKHDFIVITLVRIGFRTSLKGFNQFCTCVELYSNNSSATIGSIYSIVAKKNKCTDSSVEKNLRRLFEISDATVALGKLFGVEICGASNKEIVAMFANYIALSHDSYDDDDDETLDK